MQLAKSARIHFQLKHGQKWSERNVRVGVKSRRRHSCARVSILACSSQEKVYHLRSDDFIEDDYQVIVIGGGHAGCEAALASARMGCKTLLLTLNLDRIGWQPCNPAVGGPAKSQLVHEVDALGGEIGKMADRCYLQKRVLNRSKGPAVWALRAQTDKKEYAMKMRQVLENTENLFIREGMVTSVLIGKNDQVVGVRTYFGICFSARSVVLTTGTFMNGQIWVGKSSQEAGRSGEAASHGLIELLNDMGFESGRLKTGTPARVDKRTIDFSVLEAQPGDEQVGWFSFDKSVHIPREQMCCYLTHTNHKTHKMIRENLHETPTYGGWVDAKGPRYCPSIEDKIVRFAEKESHQVFLEPEGRSTPEIYVQGFSTGLPERFQLALLRTLPGLERCTMLKPAYAVEYGYLPATQCSASLMTKKVEGLFFSGQVNGTTGYEEAAAQGMIAGINAAKLALDDKDMLILPRNSSYIGTLIDDLVTKDLREPYRMLTSRSEYRLLLRADNADKRLTPIGRDLGLIDDSRWQEFTSKQERIENEIKRLRTQRVSSLSPIVSEAIELSGQGANRHENVHLTLDVILRRPNVDYGLLDRNDLGTKGLSQTEKDCCVTEIKYEGFINRQEKQLEKISIRAGKPIPQEIRYEDVPSLSTEAVEKLGQIRPTTIGQAQRIGGVNPADISALLIHIETKRRQHQHQHQHQQKQPSVSTTLG